MTKLTATHLYNGLPDYWSGDGRRWDDDAGCLFAYYNGRTTLRELIDSAVDDFCMSGDFEAFCADNDPWENVTEDDVRAALLDCLTEAGRADYESGAVAECAAEYAAVNGFDRCRECNEPIGGLHDTDCDLCDYPYELDDSERIVEEGDCEPDYEFYDSPVCIFLLEVAG